MSPVELLSGRSFATTSKILGSSRLIKLTSLSKCHRACCSLSENSSNLIALSHPFPAIVLKLAGAVMRGGLNSPPTKPLLAITINSSISSCPRASLFELNSYINRLSVPIPEVLKDLKVDKDFLQANFILQLSMILVVSSSCNLYNVVLPFHAAIS